MQPWIQAGIVAKVKGKRLTFGPYDDHELLNGALVGHVKPTTTLFHPVITRSKKIHAMQLPTLHFVFISQQRSYGIDRDYIQNGFNALTFIAIVVIMFLLLTM